LESLEQPIKKLLAATEKPRGILVRQSSKQMMHYTYNTNQRSSTTQRFWTKERQNF